MHDPRVRDSYSVNELKLEAKPDMCNLSAFLTEDVIVYALAFADVPTLRALKGVSKAWRARSARPVRAAVLTIRPAAHEHPR